MDSCSNQLLIKALLCLSLYDVHHSYWILEFTEPLSKHLVSNDYVLGKLWSDKYGTSMIFSILFLIRFHTFCPDPKQIHAMNFIQMKLAIAVFAKMPNSTQNGVSNLPAS